MKERLSLLQQHRVISRDAAERCQQAAVLITQALRLSTDNEQFQMAITHLARAYDRIVTGEPIESGLDDSLWQEVINDPAYPVIVRLNDTLLDLFQPHGVPAAENSFFLSNWLSLYYAAGEAGEHASDEYAAEELSQ